MNNANSINIWNEISTIIKKIPNPGLLLVSGKNEKKNVMTIGWIQFGYIWSETVISIFIRKSRYSYSLLQENDEFSINIMPDNYNEAIAFCGEKSGSFCDKFKELNLVTMNSKKISTPILKAALISLECKIIHKNFVDPKNLNDIILARYYSSNNDYHQIITASLLNINKLNKG